jgi:hypothetical protein
LAETLLGLLSVDLGQLLELILVFIYYLFFFWSHISQIICGISSPYLVGWYVFILFNDCTSSYNALARHFGILPDAGSHANESIILDGASFDH